MNALQTALALVRVTTSALEIPVPTLEDVGKARDNAKAAAKILTASYDLLSVGCHAVTVDPDAAPVADPYMDPTEYKLELPDMNTPEEAQAAPQRDLLGGFLDMAPAAQEEAFGTALAKLDKRVGGLDDTPWLELWAADRTRAMESAVYALNHRKPLCAAIPAALEVAGWKGGLL
jgi:hypothetical protein